MFTKVRGDGVMERKSGFGNLTARLEVSLWGDDAGTTAFAVMPFLKFPTNTGELSDKQLEEASFSA